MNSRQRVYAVLRREQYDRIPRYLWFHPMILDAFGKRLGTQGFATEAALGNDILQDWVSINGAMARQVAQWETFTDEFGITWTRDGLYNMVVRHPLEKANAEQIKAFPMPNPKDEQRFAALDGLLANYGKSHFIGADVSGSIFEPAYHLRGMSQCLLDMAEGSPEIEYLFDKTMQFTLEVSLECVKRGVDWIWLGDDVGTQAGMLMSPGMWRQWLKPRMQRLIGAIHEVSLKMLIAYHSCGSIRPIIADLIEIGVDVLNPLQPKALDMDNATIKKQYGSQLSFMAGIDTQEFLVSAQPEEVRRETLRILKVMGQGGGFIFAGSHTIQPDVPAENIAALLDVLDNE